MRQLKHPEWSTFLWILAFARIATLIGLAVTLLAMIKTFNDVWKAVHGSPLW